MQSRITIYFDTDELDLKQAIQHLQRRQDLSYFDRSESAIAGMLLKERLKQILSVAKGEEPK